MDKAEMEKTYEQRKSIRKTAITIGVVAFSFYLAFILISVIRSALL